MGALRIRLVLIVGFGALAISLAWGNLSGYRQLSELVDSGLPTVATVQYLDPKNQTVEYQFQLGNVVYKGSTDDGGGYGNPDYSTLVEQQQINVMYLPTNPNVSVAGNALLRKAHSVAMIAVTGALIFFVGVALIYSYFFAGGARTVRELRKK